MPVCCLLVKVIVYHSQSTTLKFWKKLWHKSYDSRMLSYDFFMTKVL